MPSTFALLPNFPNPFNPGTAIPLDVPSASHVRLVIYDATGQRIRTLVAGPMEAGSHLIRWDGLDADGHRVGSGAYFAHVISREFSALHKMMLLR